MHLESELKNKLLSLTRDLILIPSTASKPGEIERCLEFIKNHIDPLENVVLTEFRCNGIPSLLAKPKNLGKPKIFLCGHLDVVDHSDLSCYKSIIVKDRIIGPGAGDMKGALAILMELFFQFHSQSTELPLGLVITADEEVGGSSGIEFLIEKGELDCDVAIIPDGGSLQELIVEEKGILHLQVHAEGQAAHAARPWLGMNPLSPLLKRLKILSDYFESLEKADSHWYPTCTLTSFQTSTHTINRIPSRADCKLDIRFTPPFSADSLLTKIKEILGSQVQVKPVITAEPTLQSPDPEFLSIIEEITGEKPKRIRSDAGSDARFFSYRKIPAIVSGPNVGNLHTLDEWIGIDSMIKFYKICESYLQKKLSS